MTFSEDDFILTDDDEPTTTWYQWLLFPFWLFAECCKGFYIHILKPDPPDWREKKAAREAKREQIWDAEYRRKKYK